MLSSDGSIIKTFFPDFVRTGLSRLTFTANGTQTIPLGIRDDNLDELEMETFSITLVNPLPPDCMTISPDLATITIIDNDEISKERSDFAI